MAFGAANLVRHVVISVTTAEIPQPIRVASWGATALVVIIVINSVAVALLRRGDAAPLGQTGTLVPMWPLHRHPERGHEPDGSPANADRTEDATQPMAHSIPGPSREDTVTNQQLRERPTTSTKWAPWWLYLVMIVGANQLRRAVGAEAGSPAMRVVVALSLAAALFIMITVVCRATARRDATHTTRP